MANCAIRVPNKYQAAGRLVSWRKIKNAVLGKAYDLSIALVDDKEMRRAEKLSRHKKHANVLSFGYDKNSGEILLNIPRIRSEAKKLGEPFKNRLVYLYLHSLLHLKGFTHDRRADWKNMRLKERICLKKFGF